MLSTALHWVRQVALLLVRVTLGVILIYHGWVRLKGVDGMSGNIRELRRAGVPAAGFVAWMSVIVELLGGILLLAGAVTPVVAALVVAWMLVQIMWVSWRNGMAATNGGWELPAALGALALVLTCWGAGRASLDTLLRPPPPKILSDPTLVDDFPVTR